MEDIAAADAIYGPDPLADVCRCGPRALDRVLGTPVIPDRSTSTAVYATQVPGGYVARVAMRHLVRLLRMPAQTLDVGQLERVAPLDGRP
jgi:hypothetical protein